MEKDFKFYNYVFANSISSLVCYLNAQAIEFKINKCFISFRIECSDCKQPVEVKAFYKENIITDMRLRCYPKSYTSGKNIELSVGRDYKLKNNDINNSTKEYVAEGYSIFLKNPYNIEIIVEFEIVSEKEQRKREWYNLPTIIGFTGGGLALSVLFITLYFCFRNIIWVNILTALIAISYAFVELYFCHIKNSFLSRVGKLIMMVVMPLLFLYVFILIILFLVVRITGEMTNPGLNWIDFSMVLLYSLPSFHIILLIMAGLSYA